MPKKFTYQFEWNPKKAKKNLKEHGIAFERAATVFLDAAALSIYDEEHSESEDRWITLGIDRNGTLLIVSHTYRAESESGARIRVISAFKPTKKEAREYGRK